MQSCIQSFRAFFNYLTFCFFPHSASTFRFATLPHGCTASLCWDTTTRCLGCQTGSRVRPNNKGNKKNNKASQRPSPHAYVGVGGGGTGGEILPPEGQTLCSKVRIPKFPYVLCSPPLKPKIGILLAHVCQQIWCGKLEQVFMHCLFAGGNELARNAILRLSSSVPFRRNTLSEMAKAGKSPRKSLLKSS